MNSAALTYSDLHSTYINNRQSTVPPANHWYEAKRPSGSLFLQCSRQEQTIDSFPEWPPPNFDFQGWKQCFSNLCKVFSLPGISRTHS
ncbi:RNase H domain-containing protein [Trichonephila clavipes]|nr:RNase H domain-containing protein [Trichonephila clavipes]